MSYYEVTVVEYNETNGYYYKEHSICQQVALTLNILASYYACLWIMKSWISNFFQPWQSVPTTSKSQVRPSDTVKSASFLTASPSQPIEIGMAASPLPGSNLYNTYNMGSSSDPHCTVNNVCNTTFSLAYIAFEPKRYCDPALCKRDLVVGTPPMENISMFSKWKNNFVQSSPALNGLKRTGLWSMLNMPNSAPSVLCTAPRVFVGQCRTPPANMLEVKTEEMRPGAATQPASISETDSLGHKSAEPQESTPPEPSYASCKNPLIAYILGCSVDDTIESDADTWSEVDDDDRDIFDGCEINLESIHSGQSASASLSDDASSDAESTEGACSDYEDEPTRMSSSSSDYWSEEECLEEEAPLKDTSVDEFSCKLLKPICNNPLINFILNCSDHEDDVGALSEEDEEMFHLQEEAVICGGEKQRARCSRVTFTDKPPKVHHMYTWAFAYRQSRRGPWECHARDRERFQTRIRDVGRAISWCLLPQHRASIRKTLDRGLES